MATDAPKTSLLDRVKAMATELGLEGDEAKKYINQHMERAGWDISWVPPENNDGGGSKKEGGWF
jgi:hypothetical protein